MSKEIFRYCRKCVQCNTRPSIRFNPEGICPACEFNAEAPHIDWNRRRQELQELVAQKRKLHLNSYDCIIGVSGGKDSVRQALFARDEAGLNPLLVCCSYPPEQQVERGARNISNLIDLGFDTLLVSPGPETWKSLLREGFLRFGNWAKSTEMALYSSAPRVALQYGIPLVFLGENPAITIGDLSTGSTTSDANNMRNSPTLQGGPEALKDASIKDEELFWYRYPSIEEFQKAKLSIVYLGYYIKDFGKIANAQFSIAHGMEVRSEGPDETGDLTGYEALDEDFVIINQMLKYFKFGFGKVTDQVCEEIRLGKISRDEGIKLVERYDGRCAPKYIDQFCKYTGLSQDKFWSTTEGFINQQIFKKTGPREWKLRYPVGYVP